MSLTSGQISGLNFDQRARGCAYKYAIREIEGEWTWEQVAIFPMEQIRDILFPYLEPTNFPNGPYTVFCGMSWAAFKAALELESSIEQQGSESDFDWMGRLLAA